MRSSSGRRCAGSPSTSRSRCCSESGSACSPDGDLGEQYFAGYLVEKSLPVDNLFVFVIIIGNFAVPPAQQPKALTIGIVVALVLRGVFIALGAALLETFSFMFLIFGLVLTVTAVQLYRHRRENPSVEDNLLVRAARRHLPISKGYEDGRIVSGAPGRYALTPLFLALLAIGTSDLLFAFDSIPAVFGVTDHAYIVFCANAFALLGLRALYFLVDDLLRRLVHLSTGLAAILAFIGIKLVLEFTHHQFPAVPAISTGRLSLAVIGSILLVTAVASLVSRRRDAGAPPPRAGCTGPGPPSPTRRASIRWAANPLAPTVRTGIAELGPPRSRETGRGGVVSGRASRGGWPAGLPARRCVPGALDLARPGLDVPGALTTLIPASGVRLVQRDDDLPGRYPRSLTVECGL